MTLENALVLVDRVCAMAALNREDHMKILQALELIKQSLFNPKSND